MKISIISKAVCAVAIMFSLSSFAADKKEKNEKNSAPNKVALNAAVFQLNHTNKVKLAVNKGSDSHLKIVLKDKDGRTFYAETYGKEQEKYRRVFDLEDMTDGTYYFELTSGDQKLTKEIDIHTNRDRVISID